MDVISTLYKELFNIKLMHTGFASPKGSEIFNYITIEPDDNTNLLFKRFDIGYRTMDDTIKFFIHSDLVSPPAKEPKKPFVALDIEFKLRLLLFASPYFITNTYTVSTGSKSVYYFTNRINNVQGASTFLSKAIQTYNAGTTYDAGTVVNHAGEPYASVQPINGAAAIPIGNTSFWKKILPSEQVINNADLENTTVVKPGKTCFAVIDIFRTGTTNATYNLVNASGHLLSPVFSLPFKSRI